jgi:IPT/TIG domain
VKRFAVGTLSLIEFTPNQGAVGSTVTLYGTGFSATASANSVKFNGTVAAVTSASTNQLIVTVPSGATTGKITVTAGATTVTSLTNYVVSTTEVPPTISSFTPAIVAAGSTVTITGTSFDPVANRNSVTINGKVALVASATATQLQIVVPSNAGSSRIRIGTVYGVATSANNLIIPPIDFAISDVAAHTSAVVNGGDGSLSVSGAGKVGFVLFDATAGQHLGAAIHAFTPSTSGDSNFAVIYDPENRQFGTGCCKDFTMDFKKLALSGTYTLSIKANSSASFSAKATLSRDLTGTLTVNAPRVTANVDRKGRNVRYTFSGTAGEIVKVPVTKMNPFEPLGGASILQPDGSVLAYSNFVYDAVIESPALPATGIYAVFLSPEKTDTGAYTLGVVRDQTGTIVVDGADKVVSLLGGQKARLTFAAATGDELSLGLSGVGASNGVSVTVNDPAGNYFSQCSAAGAAGGSCVFPKFVTPGTYTMILSPNSYAEPASATLTLSKVIATALAANATTETSVALTRKGQASRITFTTTAGQKLGLAFYDLVTNPANTTAQTIEFDAIPIVTPTGSTPRPLSCLKYEGGCSTNIISAGAGTYSALLQPKHGASGGFKALLTTDLTGSLTLSTPAAISLRAGQNARYTFAGTANQSASIEFSLLSTVPTNRSLRLYVYRPGDAVSSVDYPDGSAAFGGAWQSFIVYGDSTFRLPALPLAGTYTVVVDTIYQESASFKLTLKP